MTLLTALLLGLSQPAAHQPLSMPAAFAKEAPVVCNPDPMKSIGCNAQAATRRTEVASKDAGPCNHDSMKGRACRHQQAVAINESGR